jgi:colanic acid biosynthesis glycosyl transferase WcaI
VCPHTASLIPLSSDCRFLVTGPRILFLNQVAGPLFRELAEDVAVAFGSAELLTGHTSEIGRAVNPALRVVAGPDYDRASLLRRAWSWLRYFIRALLHVLRSDRRQTLFLVSNPPFLPLIGWLANRLRRQPYCILIYDLYPGVLVKLGRLAENGLVARFWRGFNRLTWSRAALLFTIGDRMADRIRAELAGSRRRPEIHVIHNWADTRLIRPLPKAENGFLRELGLQGRTIVLYSGNLGNAHNLGGLLHAASQLKQRPDVAFVIIGSGARWHEIRDYIASERLDNVRLLPFQPESRLPQTLPAGDIAVISMDVRLAGYMVPSKTYYALAAGSALLALVPSGCEVADLVDQSGCGLRVDPDDESGVAAAIESFLDRPEFLRDCQRRSRQEAERHYARDNTRLYIEALRHPVANATQA